MTKILVCCSSGMSSSLLVSRMREEVEDRGLVDVKIGSCSVSQIRQYIGEADILLFAPQISFLNNDLDHFGDLSHTKIMTISSKDYGTLDTVSIVDMIFDPAKEESENKMTVGEAVPVVHHRYKQIQLKLAKVANLISKNRALKAISNGFASIMPATVIGSLFTVLNNLPFTTYQAWLAKTHLNALLELGASTTIDIISVYLVFFIAYYFVKSYDLHGHGAGLLAMVCFFFVTGKSEFGYELTYLGSKGMFGCMFIALSSGWLYVKIKQSHFSLHLPSKIPSQVSRSLEDVVPTFIIICVFMGFNGLIELTPYSNLHEMVYSLITSTLVHFMNNNIFSYLFFNLMINVLWFFGMHGGNLVGTITNPVYTQLGLENLALHYQGLPPAHIITNNFAKCYTSGGVGSMFALALVMTFFSKSQRYKTLGRLALPTTFFYINEPLLFGIPVVLNPLFFIPMMVITPLLACLTYFVMSVGLVPIPMGVQLPWTTPPVIYGLLQGSWKIALWEVFCILVSGSIWFPFFRVADRKAYLEEHK